MPSPLKYPCPTCKKTTEYSSENKHRPFCSKRCQEIDLGAWASEEYKVASPNGSLELTPEDDEEDLSNN